MSRRTDAFGEAIQAYHENGAAYEIRERDDGHIEAHSVEFYFSSYDDWLASDQEAVERADGRVLDVGCGAGRHALYLQGQGYEVVGLDVSPGPLAVAEERGLVQTLQLDVADLAAYTGKAFDSVVMFGNNFGLVGTTDQAPEVLDSLSSVTTDDAVILAGSMDLHQTDDPDHLAYHERNHDRGRLAGALRLRVRYKLAQTDWFDYLLASPDEMRSIVDGTGWILDEVIQNDAPFYVGMLRKRPTD